jgi:hypothetical protein
VVESDRERERERVECVGGDEGEMWSDGGKVNSF